MTGAPSIRIFATDVDGTLLDPRHEVTGRVAAAIHRLRGRGVHVVLATARYPAAIYAIQERLEIVGEPFVACQGAVVGRYAGRGLTLLDHHRIALQAARRVTDEARRSGLWASWYSAWGWRAELDDPLAGHEAEIVGCAPRRVARLARSRSAPAKVTLMAPPGHEMSLSSVLASLPSELDGSISRPDYAEIVAAGVSKAAALRMVLESLGLEEGDLAAAGDGLNDLEMIEGARVGIAMGHAPETLRRAATWTVPSNMEDGLVDGIERLFAEGFVSIGATAGRVPQHAPRDSSSAFDATARVRALTRATPPPRQPTQCRPPTSASRGCPARRTDHVRLGHGSRLLRQARTVRSEPPPDQPVASVMCSRLLVSAAHQAVTPAPRRPSHRAHNSARFARIPTLGATAHGPAYSEVRCSIH